MLMTNNMFASLALSHGLTYLLLSDFPFEDLEDGELADFCQAAQPLLQQIVTRITREIANGA